MLVLVCFETYSRTETGFFREHLKATPLFWLPILALFTLLSN